jgi:hypothetical protein
MCLRIIVTESSRTWLHIGMTLIGGDDHGYTRVKLSFQIGISVRGVR